MIAGVIWAFLYYRAWEVKDGMTIGGWRHRLYVPPIIKPPPASIQETKAAARTDLDLEEQRRQRMEAVDGAMGRGGPEEVGARRPEY